MRVGFFLGAAIVVAACSSTSPEKYPTSDSFCAAKAQAECSVASRCGVAPDSCVHARTVDCNDDAAQAANSGRHYATQLAQGCIDQVTNAYASSVLTPGQMSVVNDACERVFMGFVDKSGACAVDYDCAENRICDKGRCGDRVVKQLNDGCANAGEICGTGLYCNAAKGSVCTSRLALGTACDALNPCLESLRCDGSTSTATAMSGFCQARFLSGHACAADSDCDGTAPYCDSMNGSVCDAGIIFAPSAKLLCAQYGGTTVEAVDAGSDRYFDQ